MAEPLTYALKKRIIMNKETWMVAIATILKLRGTITEDESRKLLKEIEKLKGGKIMNTYVTINDIDERYKNIDDAIEAAEDMQLETLTIEVFNQDGKLLESQRCERNSNNGKIVYDTWGIFGYRYFDGSEEIESSDILVESISSEAEAMQKLEEMRNRFSQYDIVKVEAYSQTLYENIGDVSESIIVYERK